MRRVVGLAVELDEVGSTVAGRQLNEAKPIAMGFEAKSLGVDSNPVWKAHAFGEITLMERYLC